MSAPCSRCGKLFPRAVLFVYAPQGSSTVGLYCPECWGEIVRASR